MRQETGDIWDYHGTGYWVVITTNMCRKNDGTAVMGAGIAKQCANRFPDVPVRYGERLAEGRTRMLFPEHRLILMPTKRDWMQLSIPSLISEGCRMLANWAWLPENEGIEIALPRLGCYNGGLIWEDVRPLMESHLTDDRFVVVSLPSGA